METNGINPVLNDMVERGQLGERKILELLRLKEIVDRFATVHYVPEEQAAELEKRYGARPDILTWGDYFQTEIASRFFDLQDDDFLRIIDTVRFDLISAVMIFQGKSPDFFEKIEEEAINAWDISREEWSENEEEAVHLQILSKYYAELGLKSCILSEEDRQWFEGFVDHRDTAVG